jgi:CheY-like chemotaxis protein
VVHGIVQQHEGAITVNSAQGKGSRFDVYLPATTEHGARDQIVDREVHRGNGEKILYVDDEEPLVLLMTRLLERFGYEVSGCVEPQEALRIFRSSPLKFDAVISDLAMPNMSGTELAREILQIRPDTPIIITSGYVLAQENDAVRAPGLPDIQLKPDSVEALAKTLNDIFVSKRNTRPTPLSKAAGSGVA